VARNPFAVAAGRAVQPRTRATLPSYHGAQVSRLTADWTFWQLSSDQALQGSIGVLRTRARDLAMNTSTGVTIPALFGENVIGKDGIVLQAMVQNATGKGFDERTNQLIEAAWREWCEEHASVDGQMCWVDLETLIAESEVVDGEVLIRLVDGYDNPFGFAIDILDPDQLDHTYTLLPAPGQNEIRMGVELDGWRRPVAYWLWANHPAEPKSRQRVRVPAEQIIHLFFRKRPKQTRGVSWLAPVLLDVKMLAGYREGELVASRTAANKMGFLEHDPDAGPPLDVDESDPNADPRHVSFEAEPGLVEALPPGLTFKEWNPEHPSTAYGPFTNDVTRSIAMGVRVSYMSLSGDLNGTSYGSGRIGLLSEQQVYEKLQQRFIRRVSKPVFRRWLRMALVTGALELPAFGARRYEQVTWHPKAMPWIDPATEVDQNEREVAMCTNSLTRIAASQGRDFRKIVDERAAEIDYAAEKGVPLVIATGTSSAKTNIDQVQQQQVDQGKAPAPDSGGSPSDNGGAPKQNGNGRAHANALRFSDA
jgi:lambda family phage portal protein